MRYNTRSTVIGLGYVGLPLAILMIEKGYLVRGLDTDTQKIELILAGILPFHDQELAKVLKRVGLDATSDASLLSESKIIIVCVPTPIHSKTHAPDLTMLESACLLVAKNITKGALVIIESTINPGTCDETVAPIIERNSGLRFGKDIFLAHCPERVNPGDEKWTIKNIPRVLGANDTKSLEKALHFYTTIIDAPIHTMKSIKEAEAVKLVENSFRDVNIAFVNELAMLFDRLGIDTKSVLDGASTKPFGFMAHEPGVGVGGHCIPVDPLYLVDLAEKNEFDAKILKLARITNDTMPLFSVELLQAAFQEKGKPFEGAVIGVLGLAYKANTDDIRESPSFNVIKELVSKGVTPIVHDPYVKYTGQIVNYRPKITQIIEEADALIICTAHKEYLDITVSTLKNSKICAIIDGRNCLDKDIFSGSSIIYKGIGR